MTKNGLVYSILLVESLNLPIYKDKSKKSLFYQSIIKDITTFCQQTGLDVEILIPEIKGNEFPPQVQPIQMQRPINWVSFLKKAVHQANSEWIAVMDASLSAPLSELVNCLDYIQTDTQLDLIFGERTLKKANAIVGTMAAFEKAVEDALIEMGPLLPDSRCPFLVIKKKVLIDLLNQIESKSLYTFDILNVLARNKGLRVVRHPIRWVHKKKKALSLLLEFIRSYQDLRTLRNLHIQSQNHLK